VQAPGLRLVVRHSAAGALAVGSGRAAEVFGECPVECRDRVEAGVFGDDLQPVGRLDEQAARMFDAHAVDVFVEGRAVGTVEELAYVGAVRRRHGGYVGEFEPRVQEYALLMKEFVYAQRQGVGIIGRRVEIPIPCSGVMSPPPSAPGLFFSSSITDRCL